VTTDDLSTPLGTDRPKKRRYRLPFTVPQAFAALCGLFLIAFLGFAFFNTNPLGGEPMARVAYDPTKLGGEQAKSPASSTASTKPSAPIRESAPDQRTVTIIDGSSGQRQSVVIGGPNPEAARKGDDAPPALMAGIDSKLLESSRYGMIPTVAGGVKPFRAYAAGGDADRARAATMPAIAIVITGLGVGAAKTNDAIMKLPSPVTLAFMPYGSDPGKLVERARAQKHEILLQIPMEPFDFPDNDPGPKTLLTTLPADQNIDRLTWHMSRFQGYVGLANFMGARFAVNDAVMQPIIKEAARRGLGYLDDGSVPRSVAGIIADAQSMPYTRADVTIDTVPTPAEIDKTLAVLEEKARARGGAIGVASALPVVIDRITNWAKTLEGKGILLAPLTTVMTKSKSS